MTELPMGIESFARIRRDGFYYIDKTGLIRDLLKNRAYVNLFTRPRRFGKTLNMSMLKCFFEPGCDSALFDGLEISRERELCSKYMGRLVAKNLVLLWKMSSREPWRGAGRIHKRRESAMDDRCPGKVEIRYEKGQEEF